MPEVWVTLYPVYGDVFFCHAIPGRVNDVVHFARKVNR